MDPRTEERQKSYYVDKVNRLAGGGIFFKSVVFLNFDQQFQCSLDVLDGTRF